MPEEVMLTWQGGMLNGNQDIKATLLAAPNMPLLQRANPGSHI